MVSDGDAIERALRRNQGRNIEGVWRYRGSECIGGSLQGSGASRAQIARIRRASKRHLGRSFADINDFEGEQAMRRKMQKLARKLGTTPGGGGVDTKKQEAEQKRAENTARKHTSAAPIRTLGAALVTLLVVGVVLRVVWPLITAFVATLLSYLLVMLEAAGLTALAIGLGVGAYLAVTRPDWAYVKTWRAQRTGRAIEAQQAEMLDRIAEREQLFALPASNTVADEALRAAWLPTEEKEQVRR